jgi:hypothetical protein
MKNFAMNVLSFRNSFFAIALISLVALSSCESDVTLNAPYKSTTVIFGLLDADANADAVTNALDTQWIKINRTFLGSGNNLTYAQVRDSSEYSEDDFISKKVVRYYDGSPVEEWNLTAITTSNKSVNGIFYGPEQTLYYFVPPAAGLDEASTYRLEIDFKDKEDVYAETNIINAAELQFTQPQIATTINFASGSANSITYTQSARIKWYGAQGAKSYEAIIRFHYKEFLYDNPEHTGTPVITDKFIDFNAGKYKADDSQITDQYEIEFSGESFFTLLQNTLEANPNIKRQIGYFDGSDTRCFDLLMSMGNDQLNTYIEVNSPVSGIVQERPSYTNVSNGLGLFAARSQRSLLNLKVVSNSAGGNPQIGNLHALCGSYDNSHTMGLNFCTPGTEFLEYQCD